MPTLSARAHGLQESPIRKLDLTAQKFPEVRFHRLNIGQPDVATPEPLLKAISDFQPNVIAYGPASGLMPCREAAAAYHSRWCPSLTREHVAVTTGGSEALLFAFSAICDPGDEILVPEPYYTNYNGFGSVVGVKIRPIPTRLEDGFAIPDNATLDSLVTPKTKAILFSNPGNPTGAVYGKAELTRLIGWAKKRDLFAIADEVYRRIYFGEPPTSALEMDAPDHVVLIDSLSKTYSACGIRLGFLISRNASLMEKVERLGQSRLGPQPLAQHVAIAALGLPEPYYERIRQIYRGRVDVLMNALMSVDGVRAHRPEGAFYSMLDLPVDDADAFAKFLVRIFRLDGESVVVAPGGGFYADADRGRTQIRLAAVLETERLQRAAEILAAGIRAYGGRVA